MDKTFKDIDWKIRESFRLFQNLRPEAEDQKIYEKVYALCLEEIVAFLADNLSQSKQQALLSELDRLQKSQTKKGSQMDSSSQQQLTAILTRYLKTIDQHRFKLDKRLKYFIDNLLLNSLKKLSTRPESSRKTKP